MRWNLFQLFILQILQGIIIPSSKMWVDQISPGAVLSDSIAMNPTLTLSQLARNLLYPTRVSRIRITLPPPRQTKLQRQALTVQELPPIVENNFDIGLCVSWIFAGLLLHFTLSMFMTKSLANPSVLFKISCGIGLWTGWFGLLFSSAFCKMACIHTFFLLLPYCPLSACLLPSLQFNLPYTLTSLLYSPLFPQFCWSSVEFTNSVLVIFTYWLFLAIHWVDKIMFIFPSLSLKTTSLEITSTILLYASFYLCLPLNLVAKCHGMKLILHRIFILNSGFLFPFLPLPLPFGSKLVRRKVPMCSTLHVL